MKLLNYPSSNFDGYSKNWRSNRKKLSSPESMTYYTEFTVCHCFVFIENTDFFVCLWYNKCIINKR